MSFIVVTLVTFGVGGAGSTDHPFFQYRLKVCERVFPPLLFIDLEKVKKDDIRYRGRLVYMEYLIIKSLHRDVKLIGSPSRS